MLKGLEISEEVSSQSNAGVKQSQSETKELKAKRARRNESRFRNFEDAHLVQRTHSDN